MNGVQTRFKCKLDVKRCKRFVFPPSSLLPRSNALKTKAIRYFQTDRTLTRIVSPPLDVSTNQTLLILSEKKQIAIQGKESKLHYNQQGKLNVNSQTINQETENDKKKDTYNQLIVPAGKRSSITFSDGTRIWLSASSRVVYPVEFMKNKREIYVEGEAFLDVYHDKSRPFIVKTNKMDIQVLGTTFNVCAYEKENIQTVVLVTGKVEVKTNNNETKTLSP